MTATPAAAAGSQEVLVEAAVNGSSVSATVPSHRLLIDFLRDDLGLTSVKRGCDVEVCGACTVLVEGLPMSACCTFAADVDGKAVQTCEGLGATPVGSRLQEAFVRHGAMQCGYCTPGMLMAALGLSRLDPHPSPDDVREHMTGNLCRCTGYVKILEAVVEALGAEGSERA